SASTSAADAQRVSSSGGTVTSNCSSINAIAVRTATESQRAASGKSGVTVFASTSNTSASFARKLLLTSASMSGTLLERDSDHGRAPGEADPEAHEHDPLPTGDRSCASRPLERQWNRRGNGIAAIF